MSTEEKTLEERIEACERYIAAAMFARTVIVIVLIVFWLLLR